MAVSVNSGQVTERTVGYSSTPKRVVSEFRGGGRGTMLLAVAFGWFLSISTRMVYPALLPNLRSAYGLTLTTAGLLLTVLWVAYGLGQLPGGMLADRVGERLLLSVSSLVSAGMLTLVVVADSPAVLFAATALFGLGTALYGVSRFTVLTDIYPDRIGTATGVTMAAGDIGNAVMPPTAGFIAATVAWQFGFGVAIPFFVVSGVALWVLLPDGGGDSDADGTSVSIAELTSVLRRPIVSHALVLLVLWGVVTQAFIGFYPTYLIDIKGFSTAAATGLFGLFFALGSLVKPLSGRAYDRVGVRYPLLVMMSLAAVGLAAIPLSDGFWPFVGVTVLTSSILGYETVFMSSLTEKLPAGAQGTGLGTLRTVYIMLGALSPVLFGALADRGFFDEAFFGIAALSALTVAIVLAVVEY